MEKLDDIHTDDLNKLAQSWEGNIVSTWINNGEKAGFIDQVRWELPLQKDKLPVKHKIPFFFI